MDNAFDKALKSTLDNEFAMTENGACAFETSGTALVDINFAVSSLRGKSADDIKKMFAAAFAEDPLLATKWLFFARDIRSGMGERRLFRICFSWLANMRPELVRELIPLVAEYGRFDDVLRCGLEGELHSAVVDYVASQLKSDMESEHPSLLAKWMPSCNTSSLKTRELAKKLRQALGMSEKQYRKALSSIRAKLNVVEASISANKWHEVNYNAVPSLANLKYKDAFMRHDEKRRKQWLEDLKKPESGAKVNSAVSFPCDIVNKYDNGHLYAYAYGHSSISRDDTLEAMWQALPDYTKGKGGSTLCVVDTSGSMMSTIGSGSMQAMHVALSLGIYFSERLDGPFKDKFISFSHSPKYIDLHNSASLAEKLDTCLRHAEVANTDIKKTFDLVLKTAVDFNLKQEDLPSTILVVSDMHFDVGTSGSECNRALMQDVAAEFAEHGYKLPKLVYWCVTGGRDRSTPVPMQKNDAGVILMSGFSPALVQMAFSSKLDPHDALVEALSSKRYDLVEQAFKAACA